MVWKQIDSPTSIADVIHGKVLCSFPLSTNYIKNWEELGRYGPVICAFKPTIKKEFANFNFYMGYFGKQYGLILEKEGLIKKISSTHTKKIFGTELDGITKIEIMPKNIGQGNYEDYKFIAKYTLKRFPKIPIELLKGINEKLKNPQCAMWYPNQEKILKQFENDWEDVKKETAIIFYNFFCQNLIKEENIPSDKIKNLIEMLSPLKE